MKTYLKLIIAFLGCQMGLLVWAQESERLYLSGTGPDDTKTWEFRCSGGMNSGKWGKIEVPSCWELQGYGEYTYGRFYRTKGLRPSTETGRYRTSFKAPKGDVYKLVFEGSMTDTQVWIDGQQVGPIHQGGFTEFSYDITPFVRPGKKQTLEVLVSKESANASVNSAERRADWWLFGGIYRPVYIEVLPKEYIEHVSIDARANGEIYAQVKTQPASVSESVALSINGQPVSYDKSKGCWVYPNPKTWDPEHPNLYTATFTLDNGHSFTQKIGFRTIEVRPYDGIYLNDTKLLVKGTNRHCFHPETGRSLSKAMSLEDGLLLKQMNMNAVRCHYPSDRHFLEVCDSLGLLYFDELAGWQTHYDDTTAVRMTHEMVKRDVNYPCIFIWSNGNEGGWNRTVDSLFGQLDIQHRHVVHPWSDFGDIDTHHYPAYQTGTYRLHNGQKIFMPTEFLHGKYDKGQGAALEDMWGHWTRSPLFAGGFIWAYVDEAVRRTDLPTGKSKGKVFGQKGFDIKDCILDSDGGHGPDGCLDPYRQPEASFYTIREVWSPIYIDRLHVGPSFDGRVLVSNRFLFTHLKDCKMDWRVKDLQDKVLVAGSVSLPAIAPGESGYAHFELPTEFRKGEVLELRAFDHQGKEVCHWTAPIHRADEQTCISFASAPSSKVASITFNEQGIFTKDGLEGPFPVGMKIQVRKHTQRVEADGTIVNTFWYKGGIDSIQWRQTPDGLLHMDAVMLNDERGHGLAPFFTDESKWQLGLTFNYPEEKVDSVSWVGRGPYRVWRNRLKGQQFGLWKMAYNNTATGEYNAPTPPVYPEFKGYRSDLRWMEMQDKEGSSWRVATLNEGLYLRLFTPVEPVDQTPGEMGGLQETAPRKQERSMVRFPEGDISFLLSIPPIQSYKPLEQLGPLSQPDNIRIKSGDEGFHIRLIFDFRK